MPIDLSKATHEELMTIHNEVLRHIATQTKAGLGKGEVMAGHDSHGSNHSNNKMPAFESQVDRPELQSQVAEILRRQR